MSAAELLPDPWQILSEAERNALLALARQEMQFETLEERGSDRLDFREVSVWGARDALARAFLAGAGRFALAGLPPP